MVVRAKAAGEVGPAAEDEITTPPEGREDGYECEFSFLVLFFLYLLDLHPCVCSVSLAPSTVQDLRAVAEDSVSIRVSWRSPAQPNGPIIQYRLQVLVDDVLLQDITLTGKLVSYIMSSLRIYTKGVLPHLSKKKNNIKIEIKIHLGVQMTFVSFFLFRIQAVCTKMRPLLPLVSATDVRDPQSSVWSRCL